MLVEFSVKNFLSFKEKTTFSMESGIGNENEDNIIKFDNERVLKTTAIYGANASGKTNLVKAFSAAILMIRKSNNRQVGEKLLEMEPFAFDEETKIKPCEFMLMEVNIFMDLLQIKKKCMKNIYISI